MLRRNFIKATAASLCVSPAKWAFAASPQINITPASFDASLEKLQSDGSLIRELKAAGPSEGQTFLRGILTHAIVGRRKSDIPISDRAKNLIVVFEVTSEKHYTSSLQKLTWPEEQSGATAAVGYDIGYVTPKTLADDWSAFIDAERIKKLSAGCGLKGLKAKKFVAEHQDVAITWNEAISQFHKQMVPFLVGQTLASLPKNAERLPPDSLGAICSLVYNRGASFRLEGERYAEMRNIRRLIAQGNFDPIPDEIRNMKHIWLGKPKVAGLLARRDLEADLFALGLKSL